MIKHVAVTGANGYLGSRLVPALTRGGFDVQALARPGADITDAATWRRAVQADAIVHLAAQTSSYKADADPRADFEINVRPIELLIEAAHAANRRPFVVLAGAATQVGLASTLPVGDGVADVPVTAYDKHKLQAEQLVLQASRQGGLDGCALRLANVYGPGPRGAADRGILNLMIRRAMRGEDLTLWGDGSFVRDYVFVDDVVDAFVAALQHGPATNGGHFVIGSGQGHTIAEAFGNVAAIAAQRGYPRSRVVQVPFPEHASPIERRHFVADTSAFRAATGWQPYVSLSDGIGRTFASFETADS